MIIGVTGPLCSGKDVLAKILVEKGFETISTGDILREEMREKGIEVTRENLQIYSRKMRKEEGIGYPSNRLSTRIKDGKNYVIQGLRNDEEGKEIKKLGGVIVAVDAPAEIRFERMKHRSREKDPVTQEKFKEVDERELYGKGEKGFGFNIRACMDLADYKILNDGSLENFQRKIEELLEKLGV